MTARKTIFGFCAIGAMLLSAIAVQGAGAVSQTGVTCTDTGTQISGTGKFSDEHCKSPNAGGSFFHAAWAGGTRAIVTNVTTGVSKQPAVLKATIGGLETIIEASAVPGEGEAENGESKEEMFLAGKASTIKFSEVMVTNRACEFIGVNPGGTETKASVETQPIKGSTAGQAKGVVKFEPQAGSTAKFVEFKLAGVSCPAALVGSYPVFGTILSNAAEGATVPIAHETVTVEPSPKLRLISPTSGPIAGLEGRLTYKYGVAGTSTSTWHPFALT